MARSSTSFRKGQSGNPGGRPAGIGALREQLRKLEPKSLEKLKAALEDPDPKVYMDAVKHIHAYLYGKPAQAVELTGKDGDPIRSETEVKGERRDSIDDLAGVLRTLGLAGAIPQPGAAPETEPGADAQELEVLGSPAAPDAEGSPTPQ